MQFRKDINGLRAIAVLLVIVFHLNEFIKSTYLSHINANSYFYRLLDSLSAGYLGVDIFFVISGFLMTSIIFSMLANKKQESYIKIIWSFWKQRAKRICPALSVAIVFFSIFAYQLYRNEDLISFFKESRYALYFVSNLRYARELGYFDTSALYKTWLHTWSLSVEWQFYILYPIILSLLKKYLNKNYIVYIIILCFCVSLVLSLSFQYEQKYYYMLYTRAWELLAGAIVFLLPININNKKLLKIIQYLGLSLILIGSIIVLHYIDSRVISCIIVILGTVCVLWSKTPNFLLDNFVCQYLGKISYSLYLYHWPVLVIAFMTDLISPFIIIVIFVLACLSYHFIESTRNYSYKFLVFYIVVFCLCQFFTTFDFSSRIKDEYKNFFGGDKYALEEGWSGFYSREKNSPNLLNDNGVNIYLTGDSHARHFSTVLLNSDIKFAANFHDGILSVGNLTVFPQVRENKDFDKQSPLINENLQRINKDDIVIISHYWQGYYIQAKDSFYTLQMPISDGSLRYKIKSHEEFSDLVVKSLTALFEKNKYSKFIIIGSSYSVPLNLVTKANLIFLDTPLAKLLLKYKTIDKTFQADLKNAHIINELLKNLCKKYNNVIFINPLDYLCNLNKCLLTNKFNIPITFDSTHYTYEGSKFVGEHLIKMIQEIESSHKLNKD